MSTTAIMPATQTLNSHEASGSIFAATGACRASDTRPNQAQRRWTRLRNPELFDITTVFLNAPRDAVIRSGQNRRADRTVAPYRLVGR